MKARFRLLASVLSAIVLLVDVLPRADQAYAATFTVTTTQDAPHTTPLY